MSADGRMLPAPGDQYTAGRVQLSPSIVQQMTPDNAWLVLKADDARMPLMRECIHEMPGGRHKELAWQGMGCACAQQSWPRSHCCDWKTGCAYCRPSSHPHPCPALSQTRCPSAGMASPILTSCRCCWRTAGWLPAFHVFFLRKPLCRGPKFVPGHPSLCLRPSAEHLSKGRSKQGLCEEHVARLSMRKPRQCLSNTWDLSLNFSCHFTGKCPYRYGMSHTDVKALESPSLGLPHLAVHCAAQ